MSSRRASQPIPLSSGGVVQSQGTFSTYVINTVFPENEMCCSAWLISSSHCQRTNSFPLILYSASSRLLIYHPTSYSQLQTAEIDPVTSHGQRLRLNDACLIA